MGEEGSLEWSLGRGMDTDKVEGNNEKEVEEKLVEEIEWPCGVCGSNVMDDGIERVDRKKWCHMEECTEVLTPIE